MNVGDLATRVCAPAQGLSDSPFDSFRDSVVD